MEKQKTLSEQTAYRILSMIRNSSNAAGTKLPNETELCKLFNVSRSTLREAIRILSAQGIVTAKRGSGTFVCSELPISEPFIEFPAFSPAFLKDLHEFRLLFEPSAAALACQRATEKERKQILYYGNLTEQAIRDQTDRTEADQAFHHAIIKAAHNDCLAELLPIIDRAISKTVIATRTTNTFSEYTLQDHKLITQFFQARDPLGVKVAMQLHIVHAITALGDLPPQIY